MKKIQKIAILTAGGDCPGLNPVIRAVTRTAISKYGLEVVGVKNGYFGLYHGNFIKLGLENIDEIITRGGTILGSSNKDNLFQYPVKDENGNLVRGEDGKLIYEDVSDVAVKNLEAEGVDAIFILGGDGSLTSARDFARKGVNVIGIPKTIDNDLAHTDYTFGFDTAISVATESIDRVRTTGMSHDRIMVVEIMGRGAGWMTLHAGIAGAVDAILIPEIPYDINKVAEKINADKKNGKTFAIVAVAEGAKALDGKQIVSKIIEDSADSIRLGGVGAVVADQLEKLTGLEARATTLGHIQRGGIPSPRDRVLSLNERERYWIKEEKSLLTQWGYNVLEGGKNCWRSFLTPDDVEKIKNMIHDEISYSEIQQIYPISKTFISDINNGKYFFDEKEIYPLCKYRISGDI